MAYVTTRRVIVRGRRRPRPALGCPGRRLGDDAPPIDPFNLPSWADQPQPGEFKTIDKSLIAESGFAPSVTPATLLAAAGLPGAPFIVQQAAASYRSANRFGALTAGSVAGIPMTWLLGVGGFLILIPLLKGRRR
jgi:hypothetical protein